jgi:hypothetical protein
MNLEFQFVTGTSSLALYGQGTLDDRLEDDPDWWTLDWEDLPEIRSRRLCLFELGSDGLYLVRISSDPHPDELISSAIARVQGLGFSSPNGRVYIGAADCLPSDGLRPDETVKDYGRFYDLGTGDFLVDALRLPSSASEVGGEVSNGILALRVYPASQGGPPDVPGDFRLVQG